MYDHLNCHYNYEETSGGCGHLKGSYTGIREGFLEEVLPLVGFKVQVEKQGEHSRQRNQQAQRHRVVRCWRSSGSGKVQSGGACAELSCRWWARGLWVLP